MKIKITRKMLLAITASLGIIIILYSLIRHFTGFGLSERAEKYLFDGIIIAALGLLMYNRKLARDERLAREKAEEAARRAEEEESEPEKAVSPEDENLPHWERHKILGNAAASEEEEDGEEDYEEDENERGMW
jgi:putative Mn2+ efflux pump MntP